MRRLIVLIHRWLGLAMAGFLLLTGLTGALLAWNDELDGWLAPELHFVAPPAADAQPVDPFLLRERIVSLLAQRFAAGTIPQVDEIPLRFQPGRTVRLRIASEDGGTMEVFVDPWRGTIAGMRPWGEPGWDLRQFMPFVARLHFTLALPDPWGTLLLGIVAVMWTIDCFAGASLTLPKGRPLFPKWRAAWLIKRGAGPYRRLLDLHRAGGLWPWALLLVLAWSSVMFTLRDPVYMPVMSAFLPFDRSWRSLAPLPSPLAAPALGWRAAHAQARQRMRELAATRGFVVDFEESLRLDRRRGVYAYLVHGSLDLRQDAGNTGILIDAGSGELRGQWLPTGGHAGNTVSNWLGALHMGHVFGRPYRLLLALAGLATASLALTGVLLWWRKRRAAHRPRLSPGRSGVPPGDRRA